MAIASRSAQETTFGEDAAQIATAFLVAQRRRDLLAVAGLVDENATLVIAGSHPLAGTYEPRGPILRRFLDMWQLGGATPVRALADVVAMPDGSAATILEKGPSGARRTTIRVRAGAIIEIHMIADQTSPGGPKADPTS